MQHLKIGSEQFYTIGTEGENVKLLAKYNLMVGNKVVPDYIYGKLDITNIDTRPGIQDKLALGDDSRNVWYGTTAFSENDYWSSNFNNYSIEGTYESAVWYYIYDNNSLLYNFVENYGITVEESRLIKHTELSKLGCDFYYGKCDSNLSWVYSTSYWTGVADSSKVWTINTKGGYGTEQDKKYINQYTYGVRPVIVISKDYF